MRSATPPIAVVVLGTMLGCAPSPTPPPAAPRTASAPPPASFEDAHWGLADSERFFLSLPLPGFSEWKIDDRSGRWLVATHLPSKSMLLARSWREGSVASHSACEAAARSWRPDLLGRDETALVDRRAFPAPAGYDGEVGFSVRPVKGGLGGVAVLSAAKVRRCVVLAYVTRADGDGAATAVANRLAFVVARIFARTTELTVEDRVPAPAH